MLPTLDNISTVYSLSMLVTFYPERNHMIVSLVLVGTVEESKEGLYMSGYRTLEVLLCVFSFFLFIYLRLLVLCMLALLYSGQYTEHSMVYITARVSSCENILQYMVMCTTALSRHRSLTCVSRNRYVVRIKIFQFALNTDIWSCIEMLRGDEKRGNLAQANRSKSISIYYLFLAKTNTINIRNHQFSLI